MGRPGSVLSSESEKGQPSVQSVSVVSSVCVCLCVASHLSTGQMRSGNYVSLYIQLVFHNIILVLFYFVYQ